MDGDPLEVDCPSCMSMAGEPCTIDPEFHHERIRGSAGDAWVADLTTGVLHLDPDAIPKVLDLDAP